MFNPVTNTPTIPRSPPGYGLIDCLYLIIYFNNIYSLTKTFFMKFFLSCLLLILCSSLAHAQLDQGTWLVGGSFNFSTYEYSSPFTNSNTIGITRNTSLNVNPSIGYFIFNKFAAGIKPQFSFYRSIPISNTAGESYLTRFWIGPFLRYYLFNMQRQWNLLCEANYQYEINWDKPNKEESNNYSFNIGPVVYLNSSVGIEFLMGYYYLTYGAVDNINVAKGIQLNIGLQIHLTK
jgi:hypothetical protein